MPATCPAGTIGATTDTDMTCGDLVPAVCCYPTAQCVGSVVICCGPTGASHAPICENGFRTCPSGDSAGPPGSGCR
jgi:hypothetical protein